MFQDFRAFTPKMGYRQVYRARESNHCPGCGQAQWIVGRTTAECAFCSTALPLQDGAAFGSGLPRSSFAPGAQAA